MKVFRENEENIVKIQMEAELAGTIKSLSSKILTSKTGSFYKNAHTNKRNAFSVAEAFIVLLIGSIALGMTAPMITKQIKHNNTSDVQASILLRRIEALERQIAPIGSVKFFYNQGCPDGWENIGFDGHYIRITSDNNKVGSTISPSLPNITGGFPGVGEWNDKSNPDIPAAFYDEDKNEKASADGNIKPRDGLYGSFYRRTTINHPPHGVAIMGGGEREDYFAFNAKYSSNVYGFAEDDETTTHIDESNEVLPRAIHLVACKRSR